VKVPGNLAQACAGQNIGQVIGHGDEAAVTIGRPTAWPASENASSIRSQSEGLGLRLLAVGSSAGSFKQWPRFSEGSGFDEDQVIRWMEQPHCLAIDLGDVVQPGGMCLRDHKEPVIAGGQER
jgi:hypothetical protein